MIEEVKDDFIESKMCKDLENLLIDLQDFDEYVMQMNDLDLIEKMVFDDDGFKDDDSDVGEEDLIKKIVSQK